MICKRFYLQLLHLRGMAMISKWSEWKRYPRPGRGENIEAPITPGIYEVRIAGSGALHSFDAVDNVAVALAMLQVGGKSWFGRRDPASLPELEYRTCATSSRADAKAAAERMIGRRETYMSGAA
jgi:hypothetical protein